MTNKQNLNNSSDSLSENLSENLQDKNFQAAMEKVLEMAKSEGAEGSDIIANQSSSMSFKAASGKLDEYKISGTQVLGVRVIKDSRVGLAYSESMDPEALKFMVKTAISNSKFSKENLDEAIRVQGGDNVISSPSELNQNEDISTEEQIAFTLELESKVLAKDKRVRNAPYNGLSQSQSKQYLMNSLGQNCFHTEKGYSCYTSALMSEGEANAMHYHGMVARKFSDLKIDPLVDVSVKHAGEFLKARPISSGKYDVVFDIEVLAEFFGNFHGVYSAKRAQDKLNPWSQKLNEKVMDSRISISDDPLDMQGGGYALFDSEGSLTKELCLIDNGKLNSFYHNTATANHFGTKSTGHAARGAKTGLNVSGSTIKIQAGDSSEKDLWAGKVLNIVAIQGLGSGSDLMSGDFSFAASGYLMQDSEIIQVVKEVTVSGNFYTTLIEGIGLLDNKMIHNYTKSFFSPLVRFNEMTVSG